MIAFLRGTLVQKSPQSAVIEVGGVGYNVFVTLGCFEALPERGAQTFVPTVTIVREDAFLLYGFADAGEKEMFIKLISVTRVGPKLACAVLSGIKAESLRAAVLGGDKSTLSRVPGIGGKTAERIIMELKDKLGPLSPQAGGLTGADATASDAVAALVNLGYQKAHAERAVAKVFGGNPGADVGTIIRKSLAELSG